MRPARTAEMALPGRARSVSVALMKRAIVTGVLMCWAMVAAAGAAEERFSKSVPAAEFSAAGLSKLSPEELARLDALVRDYKSGALEAARREAAVAADARAKAEVAAKRAEATARSEADRAERAEAKARVADAADKKSDASLLTRAKVLLTPGTQIEYTTVDAKLVGEFRGWQPRMVFTLDNGQRWQVISADSYVVSIEQAPKVKIVPGVLGTFWMHVEGHRQRAKVAFMSSNP